MRKGGHALAICLLQGWPGFVSDKGTSNDPKSFPPGFAIKCDTLKTAIVVLSQVEWGAPLEAGACWVWWPSDTIFFALETWQPYQHIAWPHYGHMLFSAPRCETLVGNTCLQKLVVTKRLLRWQGSEGHRTPKDISEEIRTLFGHYCKALS